MERGFGGTVASAATSPTAPLRLGAFQSYNLTFANDRPCCIQLNVFFKKQASGIKQVGYGTCSLVYL